VGARLILTNFDTCPWQQSSTPSECLVPNTFVGCDHKYWLFGWGSAVELLSPLELRAAMLAEAQKMVAMLGEE
jgi:hypothetical protein